MTDPLAEPHPAFETADVEQMLAEVYSVTGELQPLHGERDLNFRVSATGGGSYLLKIHNASDGADVVQMRTGALAHIARVDPTLPICSVLPTVDGASAAAVLASDGRSSQVQLFTFLEGRHASRDELTGDDLYEWGAVLARLGWALRGYFHPAARYEIQWDLRQTPRLRDQLHLVTDEHQRRLVAAVLDRFDRHVEPVLPALRAQMVHNDFSRENVLVDDRARIIGITDFGDMTHTPLVFDLAIAVADVLDGRPDSLEMAVPMIAGYNSVTPLESIEAGVLADAVTARLATGIVVAASRQTGHPAPTDFPGAQAFLQLIVAAGVDAVTADWRRAAAPASRRHILGEHHGGGRRSNERPAADVVAARRRVLGPLELSYDEPLHLVRGEGVHLFDADGRRYLDAYNNVPVVGHCHPFVAEAIAEQAKVLVTNTRYLQRQTVELAERLLATVPGRLDRVLLVNSGSEANDVAWRIAKAATGGDGALVTSFAYHGVTDATADLSPEGWAAGSVPGHVGLLAPPIDTTSGAGVDHPISELATRGHRPAALFLDPAFTSDGVLGPASRFVTSSVAAVRAAGGIFVADEVQAGYGRTGAHLWSIVASGVDPDLMTLGKPMGNGFPVAAVLGRSEIIDPFMVSTGYFSTFGGNTLACAAALAVLDVVEQEELVARAADVGAHLRRRLEEVASRHDAVADVRSWGLLAGIDLVSRLGDGTSQPAPSLAEDVVNAMRRLGVLIGTTGRDASTLKVRPPLVFGREHADEVAERLDEALTSLEASS